MAAVDILANANTRLTGRSIMGARSLDELKMILNEVVLNLERNHRQIVQSLANINEEL